MMRMTFGWMVLGLLAALLVRCSILMGGRIREARRRRRVVLEKIHRDGMICIRCGYNTRASPKRCSECGYEP